MTDYDSLFAEMFGSRAIIRSIATAILDDEKWFPTWATTSAIYYDKVAKHIELADPEIKRAIEDLVVMVRDKYRSYEEYEAHVQQVPILKRVDGYVDTKLDEDCCVCLRPLRGIARVCRLRSASGGMAECGHFIHVHCMSKIVASEDGHVKCPLCRTDLGPRPLRTHVDMENEKPLF